jgi:hypothetical protein
MLAEAEREILTQAITLAEGNQAKTARWLGLSRFTLREKLKQLGLHPESSEIGPETEGDSEGAPGVGKPSTRIPGKNWPSV